MDWDEAKPRAVTAVGDNLTNLSVSELAQRLKDFETEIERVRQELTRKRAHEAAAAKLFKS
jgi:uncharacterized small protein (DUF1192 family)